MFVHKDLPTMSDPFTLIGKKKLLVSAGDTTRFNTMTASWGTMGVLWNKNVFSVVIRPQRYTYDFMEREPYFTVSVLKEGMDDAYRICGTKSGRDTDKITLSRLTPYFNEKTVTFEEAELVFLCKKIYVQDIDPNGFLDNELDLKNYPQKDYHRLYCGEIIKILERK